MSERYLRCKCTMSAVWKGPEEKCGLCGETLEPVEVWPLGTVARLREALERLVDGLDANADPERLGLANKDWDKRVAEARAVLEGGK